MKKHLLMLIAVLGIATAFTSCQKDNEEYLIDDDCMVTWTMYIYVSDSEGTDLLQNITSDDITSKDSFNANLVGDYDQYWYNGTTLKSYMLESYQLAGALNSIDSYYANLLGSSNKFIPIRITTMYDLTYSNFRPEVLTFDVYCPVAFGDNQTRTLTVNLEYPNNLSFEHIVKSATLDGVQLDTRTIQSDNAVRLGAKLTRACVLNYTLD